ncbi:MAG: hypothetical protein AUK48_09440 [Oscillatoriales cyanobacterium CG2_30_44_21]|nr:MAG: hypothetical protein AUK48_09440 [Oscillatoriales cyanobacterium CG2_30_44_21]
MSDSTLLIFMVMITLVASYFRSGWLISFVGLATALIIAFVKFPKIFFFSLLGELSYSLYLLHIPIGGRIINIGTRLNSNIYTQILILFFALLLSCLASYIMYKFVEKPVLRYFKNLKYKSSN